MSNIAHALRPSLLVAADIAVGGALYTQVSSPIGIVVLAVGLLLFGGIVVESVRSGLPLERRGRRTAWSDR